MLHPNAKQRLANIIPDTFEVGWRHPTLGEKVTETVEPDLRWMDDDIPAAGDYPIIAIDISPEAMPRYVNGEKSPEETYEEAVPTDDSVAYMEYTGKPLYAELNIVVAVNSSAGQIPEHVVADSIAHDLYYQYQFNSDHLNRQGTDSSDNPIDFEWPMNVYQDGGEGVVNMNRMVDEQAVSRRVMQFRVDYRFWEAKEIPALASITYEFAIDHNYDGEIVEDDGEEWFGPYYVDVGPIWGETMVVDDEIVIEESVRVGDRD